MSRKLIIGTRGSKLALTQSNWVKEQLEKNHDGLEIELKIIKTTGDRIQNIALDKIGDRGLFVKEIEEALLKGEVDLAVHSLKDMPGVDTDGLRFVPALIRADARDILIMNTPVSSLKDIKRGAVIGTGSKRRAIQLSALRPDLVVEGIRGNVDTRLKKMDDGLYDGIILAKAGLDRLSIHREHVYIFEVNEMLPAPAQGVLGIQIRTEDEGLAKLFEVLIDEESNFQALAERAFLRHINGSCHMPIGAYATINKEELSLVGLFGNEAGDRLCTEQVIGLKKDAELLGKSLAEILRERIQTHEI
jgi:hydroxymethylbilane synthase